MKPFKLTALTLGTLAAGALLGCQQIGHDSANAQTTFTRAPKNFVIDEVYRVEPPDEVTIKAHDIKEVDGSKQEVRPDGKINLNLLGDVLVAGKSVPEINAELVARASKYYRNPDIKAEVISKSKFYVVFGQGVAQPGKKPWTGHDTLLKAIADCGFSPTGWPDKIHLHRQANENGQQPATVIIDFNKVFVAGSTEQNYIIKEGDILWIPDGPLAKFNKDLSAILGPVTGVGMTAGAASGVSPVNRP